MEDGVSVADIFALDNHPESTVLVEDLFRDIDSPALLDEITRAYYTHRKPVLVPWGPLMEFMTSEVVRWKGRDGPRDTNASPTRALFKEQSKPWLWIVESHCIAVWGAIRTFVSLALRHSVHPSIRAGVRRNIVNSALNELRRDFEHKCREIVDGFTDVHPAQFVSHAWQPRGEGTNRMLEIVDKIMEWASRAASEDPESTGETNHSHFASAAESWALANVCLEVSS
ncbi:hypothetical protein B0J15DRAFT_468388 [Fusarium solani]|uniref:Uncharacterized protein n=1 Tax=Fusarium solani TaxID=169388 RepID=A0A9P9K3Y4_FUSSL|nr:uncharacterized protein B0J15DRAFT_468388 [Fusarium solani]KAH7248382.1 hypothetical protein B0J15DRAFT_468388 [Fusarium solani]